MSEEIHQPWTNVMDAGRSMINFYSLPADANFVLGFQILSADATHNYFLDSNLVAYLRGQAQLSLADCVQVYELLVDEGHGCENPFSVLTIGPMLFGGEGYCPHSVDEFANAELMATCASAVLQALRLRARLFRIVLRFLTSLLNLLIHRAGKTVVEHALLGNEKVFYLYHGARPPHTNSGLAHRRWPEVLGGCAEVTAPALL